MTLQHIEHAINLAAESAATGGGPFGAVLVTADGTVFEGVNQVTNLNDPTAHAEVMAIRAAATAQGFDLTGSTLYSSCQPCPMCATAAMWARVTTVHYAATDTQAAQAGFDDAVFWAVIASPAIAAGTHLPHPRSNDPFDVWTKNTSRTHY